MPDKPIVNVGWEVGGIRKAKAFFEALLEILPLPAYLCFEGTKIAHEVRRLLDSNAVAPAMPIPPGTLSPKPSVFHVLANEQIIRQLSGVASHHANPEICDHFHAYQNNHGLLQWYDAFIDPLLIDEIVREEDVQSFCSRLGVRYSRRLAG